MSSEFDSVLSESWTRAQLKGKKREDWLVQEKFALVPFASDDVAVKIKRDNGALRVLDPTLVTQFIGLSFGKHSSLQK